MIDSPLRCRFTEAQYYEKGALGGRAEPKACRRSKEKIQRKTPRSDRRLQTCRADISLRPWSSATGHWQRSKGRHGKDAEYQTWEPERFGWMLGTADIGNQDPSEHNDVRPNHAVQARTVRASVTPLWTYGEVHATPRQPSRKPMRWQGRTGKGSNHQSKNASKACKTTKAPSGQGRVPSGLRVRESRAVQRPLQANRKASPAGTKHRSCTKNAPRP